MSNGGSVEVELMGGLGNQLFQYFAGLRIASERNVGLTINLNNQWIHSSQHSNSNITDFNLSATKVFSAYRQSRLKKFLWRIDFFLLRKNVIYRLIRFKRGVVTDQNYHLVSHEFRPKKIKLKGYFQDFVWFEDLQNDVKKINLQIESDWFKSHKLIFHDPNLVAIHLRFGDYLSKGSIHKPVDISFYLECLKIISLQRPISKILVFSDDLSNAKSTLEGIDSFQFSYVDLPEESRASESLALMSLASTLIISGSTFSLWAGLLGNQDKFVFYPSPWPLKSGLKPESFPASWTEIQLKSSSQNFR